MGVRRDGELSERSLADALADEKGRGESPNSLAVGSRELELTARRILEVPDGLGELTAAVPAVVVDEDLDAGEWELREA